MFQKTKRETIREVVVITVDIKRDTMGGGGRGVWGRDRRVQRERERNDLHRSLLLWKKRKGGRDRSLEGARGRV